MESERRDAVVIGGGLAGLAAATYLARAGRRTLLLERAARPGGRAATQVEHGYHLNLGPHALYLGGAATDVLAELGVPHPGGEPPAGGFAIDAGRAHRLPVGALSLVMTGLLGWSGKLEALSLLARLPRLDPAPLDGVSLDGWLERTLTRPDVRALFQAMARVSTYVNDPRRVSAGLVVRQLQLVLGEGVRYVDGGWATLVDGLTRAAEAAGVEVRAKAAARAVEPSSSGALVKTDGGAIEADAVVLAVAPDEAHALLPGDAPLARCREAAAPVRAACLDLALSRLPRPDARFALGIDRPLYFSVHAGAHARPYGPAKLAPGNGAVVHAAKYLPPETTAASDDDLREVEGLLDLLQPGWREVVVTRRWLPRLTVVTAMPLARLGGQTGRPGATSASCARVLFAGDWVGPDGHLADAALASGRAAARAALALQVAVRA